MAEFKCNNKNCKRYGEEISIPSLSIKIVEDKAVAKESICDSCGEYMEDITPTEGFGKPKKADKDKGPNHWNFYS